MQQNVGGPKLIQEIETGWDIVVLTDQYEIADRGHCNKTGLQKQPCFVAMVLLQLTKKPTQ